MHCVPIYALNDICKVHANRGCVKLRFVEQRLKIEKKIVENWKNLIFFINVLSQRKFINSVCAGLCLV